VWAPDPPEGFAVSIIDCPLSIVGEVGVGSPATNAKLTATVDETGDNCVSGDTALSVTCSSNVYVSPTVSALAGMMHDTPPALTPLPLGMLHIVALL
jgi:hypothetical protein